MSVDVKEKQRRTVNDSKDIKNRDIKINYVSPKDWPVKKPQKPPKK